jgi:hypothetical protein
MKADAIINNDLSVEELRRRTDLAMGIVQKLLNLHLPSRK